jgi:sarcosine oxidase subunit gamma
MTVATSRHSPAKIVNNPVVSVEILPAGGRWSLRARPAAIDALGEAIGLSLPTRIGRSAAADDVFTLCLGPDEWVLRGPQERMEALAGACRAISDRHPHSLVDISGREVSLAIEGLKAVDLLSIGCPRDIDTIDVGGGCRTVFDGIAVVIWRDAEDRFQMDVWHSFAAYLFELLTVGSAELEAE